MPDPNVIAEGAEYDAMDCICDDEHLQIDGIAVYEVVTQTHGGLELVMHVGQFTYNCPAVLDEFTVPYIETAK